MGSASSLGRETLHTSLVESYPHIIRPKTPPTTKPGTTCRKAAPKSSGTQSNVPFAVYRPILSIIALGSEGGTVPVTAWVHAQLRTAARFDGGVTSRGDATPENIHILLPPHGLASRGIYSNFIVYSPTGASSMSSESILPSCGGTRRLDMVRMCRAGRRLEN